MTAEPCTRTPEAVTSEAFRAIFRQHPAGVAVVALRDGDRPVGFTATSVISVSADPALLTFSVAGTSSSWPALSRTDSLTISFLAAEQVDVSARFATSGVDRFAGVAWSWLPTGEPAAGPTVEPVVTSEAFRSIFRQHPAGVAVVALRDEDRPVGFTATSVISVSAEPPMLAFSVATTSSSFAALARTDTLTVNLLGAEQVDVSARFATRDVDRFAGVAWRWLPTGEPVLDDVPAWIRGRIVERLPVGSSVLIVVQALESSQGDSAAPLVYHDRAYHSLDERSAL